MVNRGTHVVKEQPDGWTIKTADQRLSAHFEHTIRRYAERPGHPHASGVSRASSKTRHFAPTLEAESSKEDVIEVEGTVVEAMQNAMFPRGDPGRASVAGTYLRQSCA